MAIQSVKAAELSASDKESIENMSYVSMLQQWRYAPIGAFQNGDPYTEYFKKVMLEKKAADPAAAVEASKLLSR